MRFSVSPTIMSSENLTVFLEEWQVGAKDLIITNEYVLAPALNGAAVPCDTLYLEKFGGGEPSDEMINRMFGTVAGKNYDRIIAIGGGTVIDISKLFVFGDGLDVDAVFAGGATLPRLRNLVVIPTTCGTGSEVTNISIVEFVEKKTKVGLAVSALYADEAVLIPSLLSTLPYEVFATSSVDALIHAVESFLSPKASLFTRSLGRSAIELIINGYQKLAASGKRELPETRDMEDYIIASTMAGISFGNAGCAAVHALSYPIGGNWHVPHGKANYMVFEAVINVYKQKGSNLTELELVLSKDLDCSLDTVWTTLFALLNQVIDKQCLGVLGADTIKCAEMATSVIQNQQRLLANNPVKLSRDEIQAVYESIL